jgi:hypothetical protein
MRKTLAIVGLLLLAICAAGQTANTNAQQAPTIMMGPPALPGPTLTLPPPMGGLVVQSGYATTVGWGYPLVTTPTVSLSILSSSPVGATNATSNLQVGATNSTVDSVSVPISATQTSVEFTQPGTAGLPEYASPQSTPPSSGPTVANAGLGAAQFDVVNARAPGETRSLGEVVREMRQQPKPAPVRTFTNGDVQNLKDQQQPTSQSQR